MFYLEQLDFSVLSAHLQLFTERQEILRVFHHQTTESTHLKSMVMCALKLLLQWITLMALAPETLKAMMLVY